MHDSIITTVALRVKKINMLMDHKTPEEISGSRTCKVESMFGRKRICSLELPCFPPVSNNARLLMSSPSNASVGMGVWPIDEMRGGGYLPPNW
jgi:hypothetical protein